MQKSISIIYSKTKQTVVKHNKRTTAHRLLLFFLLCFVFLKLTLNEEKEPNMNLDERKKWWKPPGMLF